MHARIAHYAGKPEQVDAACEYFEREAAPKLEAMHGFKDALVLADRTSGHCVTMSLWETAEDMRASGEAARRLREEGASRLGTPAPAATEEYEVVLQTSALHAHAH